MKLKEFIYKNVNRIFPKRPNMLVFIPHGGMKNDAYGVDNYKSDNSLSFLNYLLSHYGKDFQYRFAVDYAEKEKVQRVLLEKYHDIDIECFPLFGLEYLGFWSRKKIAVRNLMNVFMRASYFFTSEGCTFPYKMKNQKLIFLGYFIPFKNDYDVLIHNDLRYNRTYDCCITTSLLASQIIAHTYSMPLHKFQVLGFSRNDNLLSNEKNEKLENFIKQSADYPIKRVILYTPTHRDYERDIHTNVRSILGFEVNCQKLSALLKQYNALIICKVHSRQNTEALRKELPDGVVLHIPNPYYGLCELMQYSDCLITDYTSAYFDYLLLDRPVLFNFYDFDKYRKSRGFSFDPLNSIIAGDVFTDENSFYDRLKAFLEGEDKWKKQRIWVKKLVHKYTDTQSSQRIYDFVFHHKIG